MHDRIALNAVPQAHPVALFARFWLDAAPDGATPPWRIFDPVQHASVLPWILLLRPEPDGGLRYVICGDGCAETFGASCQGKLFGNGLPADAVEIRQQEFNRAESNRAPEFSKGSLPHADKSFIEVYRGVFPFVAADGVLERILLVIAPTGTVCR